MKMDSLHELYVEELKDLYNAEQQLVKALPKMAKAATNPKLRQAIETHLNETIEQVARLEMILGELEELGRGKKCKGMEGLIEEGKELIQEKPEKDVLDAGIISKSQHIEHYEIAGYGTVRAYAELMGHTDHAELLEKTLEEEKRTDALLSALAMQGGINVEANDGAEGEMGEEEESERGSRSASARGGSRGGTRAASGAGSRTGGSARGGSRASGTSGGGRGGSSGRSGASAGGSGTYRSTSGRSR